MPKLARNMYTTAKGERKLNCYACNIPKEVANKANITAVDDLKVYAQDNKIIIEKEKSRR
jgi:antitoxin component of MazEF toxin-antitoxin module